MPPLDVTVKSAGKVVHQGKTDAGGSFATPEMPPGKYTVEFRSGKSKPAAGSLMFVISAGKGAATQSAAPAERLSGGVAVNLDVKKPAPLSGRVTAAAAGSAAASAGTEWKQGDPLVPGALRIIKGERYVWMPPEMGSNMGGKWVPENTPGAPRANTSRGNQDSMRRMQDISGQGSVPGG
ncbi:MAG: carboxypeptidase regulatory-like domain-containing protein [Chthoniobacterales bacterium]|nr:carboxypeptidase regulatory-like domain-containing protein [Chthoniobacterales bacterium]